MQQIDYSPLGAVNNGPGARRYGAVEIALSLSTLCFIAGSVLVHFGFLVGLFMMAVTWAVWGLYRQSQAYSSNLRRFAEANGWSSGDVVLPNPLLKEMGFWFSPALIQGKLDKQPFWVHAVNSPGKLSDFDVISVEVAKKLPTLFILPNLGQFDGFIDEVGTKTGLAPMELDKTFGNKLVAYVALGQEKEAQKLLTPTVRGIITNSATKALLFVGNNIYISPNDFQDPRQLQILFESAQTLLKEFK